MHADEVSRAAAELAGSMHLKGAPDTEIQIRLTELGLRTDAARTLVEKTPLLLERTRGTARFPGPSRIFISHSQEDRPFAARLAEHLDACGARTMMTPSVASPIDAIAWSHSVVLLWSAATRSSLPVHDEWASAKRLLKDAVVVALDDTAIPDPLSAYPCVDGRDRGAAELAVARLTLRSDSGEARLDVAGRWQAVMSVYELVEAEYEIELFADGRVVGSGQMTNTGYDGALAVNLVNLGPHRTPELPLTGRWSFDASTSELTIGLHTRVRGQAHADRIIMDTRHWRADGDDWLEGVTRAGLPWRFRRIG